MLSRAVLPLLRRQPHPGRTFSSASRLAFAPSRLQYKDHRSKLRIPSGFKGPNELEQDRSAYDQPLRPVPSSPAQEPPTSIPHKTQASPAPSSQPQTSTQPLQPPQDDTLTTPEPEPEQTGRPIPDLTQGIPSTIFTELEQKRRGDGPSSKESLNITEDGDPQAAEQGRRGGDGLPRSTYVSSSDQRRNMAARYFYLVAGVGAILYALYMGRDWSESEALDHPEIANGYTPALMYERAAARISTTKSYYTDPVTKKMLPDKPANDPNFPQYTLVLGMEDFLVKSNWSREHGWRIAKRPGLDYFLKYLSLYYEVVIFSTQPLFTVDQIMRKLDPYRMIAPLYREMTTYEDGGYVKDLSYLNRDLSKTIMIDTDPHAAKRQPENAIILPKWDGSPNDKTLIDMIPFLENMANIGVKDMREVLKSFEGTYPPTEFERRQNIQRAKFEEERAKKNTGRKRAAGFSLFGSKPQQAPDGTLTISQAESEGKMYSDLIRIRGQEMYKRLEEHLAVEGPKIIAEQEADEKRQQEEAMASMKSGMMGWFGGSADKK